MRITEQYAKESAREYAFRILKKNIITMDLVPGTTLSEKELADELGLSRTPVREALIELSKASVVEIMPQKGSRITLIDMDVVEEANFFRLVLERSIAELACEMIREEDFPLLEENLKLQEFYLENPASEKLLQLDNEFHQMLFRLCKKERLYHVMASMTTPSDRVRNLTLIGVKDIKIVSDHRCILNAIKDRNKTEAVHAVNKHLSRYKLDEQELRSLYPHYFK